MDERPDAAGNGSSSCNLSPLDAAIANMLLEQDHRQQLLTEASQPGLGESEKRDLDEKNRFKFLDLSSKKGDTLMIISFPGRLVSHISCLGIVWAKQEYVMESWKLLATGSDFLKQQFTDERQHRFITRWGLNPNSLPYGVKYVIDMTPDSEGDTSAAMVAKLCLPTAVKLWWMAKERLGVSRWLVCGHDDNCPEHEAVQDICNKQNGWVQPVQPPQNSDPTQKFIITLGLEHVGPCPVREIDEYCPTRHRTNIMRLLFLIQDDGGDLVLNSASRVYTITALAVSLDLVSLVQAPVLQWLTSTPNDNFIDVNPEIALGIAWDLELHSVTRAALSVVVVERAMEIVGPQAQATPNLVTIFGRKRENVFDDNAKNVAEHATNQLATRAQEAAAALGGHRIYEWLNVRAWATLMKIGEGILQGNADEEAHQSEIEGIRDQYQRVMKGLLEYIESMVHNAFAARPSNLGAASIDNDRLAYANRDTLVSIGEIMDSLSETQLLLLSFFWKTLQFETMESDTFYNWVGDASRLPLASDLNSFMSRLNDAMYQGKFRDLGVEFPNGIDVDATQFHLEVRGATKTAQDEWAPPQYQREIALSRTDHLALCLSDAEFKFLPLWAGGNDDGSGGAYEHGVVPDADMGPIGPGPNFVTGQTVAASTTASEMTMVGTTSAAALHDGVGGSLLSTGVSGSFVEVTRGDETAGALEDAGPGLGDSLELEQYEDDEVSGVYDTGVNLEDAGRDLADLMQLMQGGGGEDMDVDGTGESGDQDADFGVVDELDRDETDDEKDDGTESDELVGDVTDGDSRSDTWSLV
ncbi:hypothetical protein BJ170DRAFT_598085 [Xylariales sp. AK1849]|nr:hypothetical protein BJ170DRAFT_598085 [Xylariales sp. AK1849]